MTKVFTFYLDGFVGGEPDPAFQHLAAEVSTARLVQHNL